jgi:very-short-patch-repair endonuclease
VAVVVRVFGDFTAIRGRQTWELGLMRRLFTAEEAAAAGISRGALRWGEQVGRWQRLGRPVYAEGAQPATELDWARARVVAANGVAGGALAGVLHGLDGVVLDGRPTPGRSFAPERVVQVGGIRCVDGFQTLVDLAATLDDMIWEQALESALRKQLTTVDELVGALPALGRARTPGTVRIRRVLDRRPVGASPTESLLETLMVQLVREVDGLPDPTRQRRIFDSNGQFVGRVDLCWLPLGLFLELDGQHHKNQPVYDARRETAIVAATGWLPGRFTWYEVVHARRATVCRLAGLADQARRRPLPQTMVG